MPTRISYWMTMKHSVLKLMDAAIYVLEKGFGLHM